MQTSQELMNSDEDISGNVRKSSYNLLVNNILIESINELNTVQSDLSDLQQRSARLEIKNQKIIENIKTMLENFNINYQSIDACTQSHKIEFHDIAVDCDIQPILPVIPETIVKPNFITQETEVTTENTVQEKKNEDEIMDALNDSSKHPEPILIISEDIRPEIKTFEYEPLQTYSKTDMLSYLAKYKIDFLKFLQSNRNNIEQFAGGYPELIRSLSCNSGTDDNSKSNSKRKPSEKSTHSRQRYKTKSNSELKPGVIDTGDHLEDPSLKSSLYDDLDFSETPDRTEVRHTDAGHGHPVTTATSAISHNDVVKMGGEKRLNAIGVQSKMNLLKSRASDHISSHGNSSKHSSHKPTSGSSTSRKKSSTTAPGSGTSATSQWKNEIAQLKSQHEAHYPTTASSSLPLVPEQEQAPATTSMMKPLETVFTNRMRERLKRPTSGQGGPSPLPVVKYDLSTPDDPSFELDSKPIPVAMTVAATVSSSKSTSTAANFQTKTSHHASTTTITIPTTSVSSISTATVAEANHSQESDSRSTKHVSYSKPIVSPASLPTTVLLTPTTSTKTVVVASSSSSSNHHHNSRDKSKHKHKHSSKKRTKKPSKDLEDGEIF